MESIAKIRRMYFVDSKGIKTIARELSISKNTVKKIIRSGETKFELTKYNKTKPVLDMYVDRLNELLIKNLEEPIRRKLTACQRVKIIKKSIKN